MKSAEIMTRVLQPYPGLRPFQKVEADVFFGRGEQIDALLATLEDNNVVAVVGASGSGKSSLVRAGLLPSLEAGFLSGAGPDWKMVVMRPGNAPFSQLAKALLEAASGESTVDPQAMAFTEATLRSGPRGLLEAIHDLGFSPQTNVLLLVDQFEEIFRFRHRGRFSAGTSSQRSTADERNDATAFVNMLLGTRDAQDSALYGVITMRSDFLGDCDAFHGLPEAINQCQFLVPRLRRDQLRDTITMPLDLFGATAEPGLVNRILNEIGSDPDQLPLMQHLLLRMWSQADQRCGDDNVVLRSSDYDAVGGLENALSLHADEVYAGLGDDASKRVAELMFRCLCDRGAEARLTRRLVTVAEVAEVAGVDAEKVELVADTFLHLERSFLTKSPRGDITTETTLDISHEALIRQWGRLTDWVSAEGQSVSKYHRLAESARLWKEGQASLLVSPELDIALDWRKREKPTKAWADRYDGQFALSMEFLDASVAEQQAQAERQRHEARRKTMGLVSTLVVVSGLTLLVFVLWLNSRAQSVLLKNRWIKSQLSLGTSAIKEGRMTEGLSRYWAAHESTTQNQPARQSVRSLIAAWSQLAGRPLIHDSGVRKATFSENDNTVLTLTDEVACLWDLQTGEPSDKQVVGAWRAVAVGPDATTVLVANDDAAQLWDVRTEFRRNKSFLHGEKISKVAITDDGKTVVTASQSYVQLWNMQTGAPRGERLQLDGENDVVALNSDASNAVVGGVTTKLLDLTSGESTEMKATDLSLDLGSVESSIVAFSPDNRTVITVAEAGAFLWNVAELKEGVQTSRAFLAHHDVKTVAFSQDGDLVLTGGADNTARLWDTRTGKPEGRPLRHEGTVVTAAFSRDGSSVLTGSGDNTARLWVSHSGEPLSPPLRHAGTVDSVAISLDGQTLLTGSVDGSTRLWQRQSHGPLVLDVTTIPSAAAAFSPDGETVAVLNSLGIVRVASTDTGQQFDTVLAAELSPSADGTIDISPDGNTILTATDGLVYLWSVEDNNTVARGFPHGALIVAASFGRRGETILTAGGRTARLWDVRERNQSQQEFRHTPSVLDAALSPDGTMVVTAGGDNVARLWHAGSGKPIGRPLDHGDVVLAVAFSPDSRLVATGSADNTAGIWNVETAALQGTPLAHRDAVSDVMFSPDGKTLLTASDDTKARLWDVASGELRGDPLTHTSQVKTAQFGPYGRQVLTVPDETPPRLWNVMPPAADDEPERLRLSIEWRTGYALNQETGEIFRLTQKAWLERKRKLDALGGPCDVRSWDELSAAERDELAGRTKKD